MLSLLYNQRQTDPEHPAVSLLDLERDMGFPREYLNFTTWYLRAKEFVAAADNSDYVITASGADFVKQQAARNDVMGNLLNPGAPASRAARKAKRRREKNGQPDQRLLV